jgi:hypothetical protein
MARGNRALIIPSPGYYPVIGNDIIDDAPVRQVFLSQIDNLDLVFPGLYADDPVGQLRRSVVKDMKNLHRSSLFRFYRIMTLSALWFMVAL